jgi:hypothetical protein
MKEKIMSITVICHDNGAPWGKISREFYEDFNEREFEDYDTFKSVLEDWLCERVHGFNISVKNTHVIWDYLHYHLV